jgi:Fis family transcriptional regulator, factor for inversion stimulation protein
METRGITFSSDPAVIWSAAIWHQSTQEGSISNAIPHDSQRVYMTPSISSLTSNRLWAIIRATSPGDIFMTLSSSVFSILLLSGDPDLQIQFKQAFKDAAMTTAKDAAALPRDAAKRTFDAVIVESKPGTQGSSTVLSSQVDLTDALVITGSRPALRRASKFMQAMGRPKSASTNGAAAPSLEDYLDWKMKDFVKGMRNGSGRNLHPMLISAIERPLIVRALQETKGNQIQAAELLGLNRNTLRKKIQDLHIPVKRSRGAQVRDT